MKGIGRLGDIGLGTGAWQNLGQDRGDYCAAIRSDGEIVGGVFSWLVGSTVGTFDASGETITATSSEGESAPYQGGGMAGTFLAYGTHRFSLKLDIEWDILNYKVAGVDYNYVMLQVWSQDGSYYETIFEIHGNDNQQLTGSDSITSDLLSVACTCPVWVQIYVLVTARNATSTISTSVSVIPES